MKAIEENKLSTTDRINIVIKRHFNKYFKQHYITKNMNEWSALRRSLKKLISLEVRLKQSQIEQLQKEKEELRERVKELEELLRQEHHETDRLKERTEELENLCAEAMGEQDKSWRNRFKQLLNKQN